MTPPSVGPSSVPSRKPSMTPSLQEGVCESQLVTTFNDNFANFGMLFDIRTYQAIQIYGMDIYTFANASVDYEIYTKANRFQDDGGQFSLDPWTLVGNGTVVGRGDVDDGMGTPVRGFDQMVSLAGNAVQGFYVRLSTPDLRSRDVQNDMLDGSRTSVADAYSSNDDLEIRFGAGVGQYALGPAFLFGPRVWCGTIHYLQREACAPSPSPVATTSSSPTTTITTAPTTTSTTKSGKKNDRKSTLFKTGKLRGPQR